MRYAIVTSAVLLAATPTVAQDMGGFARQEQLDQLSADLRDTATGLKSAMETAQTSMEALSDDASVSDKEQQIRAYFDSLESQTEDIITKVSSNSDFMDALDDARQRINTLISRNELRPAGSNNTSRDARLADLQRLKAEFDEQYEELQSAEKRINNSIVRNQQIERELIADARVKSVEQLVNDLRVVTSGITDMVDTLDQIGESAQSSSADMDANVETLSQN
jgi:DNA repair exonuclease SbcCD ATPase subunit